MYEIHKTETEITVKKENENLLFITKPKLDINVLKRSFDFVPYDNYFSEGSRYRTTSRIRIEKEGSYQLLEKSPLYQPTYVNKIESYGGIDRLYDDIPESLIFTKEFDIMTKEWLSNIPFKVEKFSIHQIRTTDSGDPTPEGPHKDGTDWTGVYIVRRYNIKDNSGLSIYWDNNNNLLLKEKLDEGSLINHCDKNFLHCASPIDKLIANEPSWRDVFVITTPEHGVNHDEEDTRKEKLYA